MYTLSLLLGMVATVFMANRDHQFEHKVTAKDQLNSMFINKANADTPSSDGGNNNIGGDDSDGDDGYGSENTIDDTSGLGDSVSGGDIADELF